LLHQVSKEYDGGGHAIHALQECTLSIHEGELFGLFGPNGAGKTTLIHVLSTLTSPTRGKAQVCGYDVNDQPLQVRKRIGVLTETQRAFHGRLSGRQNLAFFAALHGLSERPASQRMNELLQEFGLADAANRPLQTYSSGMLQRLQLVRVLLHDPPVLLLDEPTNTMDIQTADMVRHLVKDELVGKRGKTVLYTTHDLYEMDNFCDRIGILQAGRLVAQGTVAELLSDLHLGDRLRVAMVPGGEATLAALRRLPGVVKLHVSHSETGQVALVIETADCSAGTVQSVWQVLTNRQESVQRFERVGGDGIGRLLRYYTDEVRQC
jgi:ABC-2 type transport system ATP-binding protein